MINIATLQEAKAYYEQAKLKPIAGLMDRTVYSELDVGMKNPFSGTLVRARYDGVAEIYAQGKQPAAIRINPSHGTINSFSPKRISSFSKEVAFVTEHDGLNINNSSLNYDVLNADKLVFFSDKAIENLKLLLSNGVYGLPREGQMAVDSFGANTKEMNLFNSKASKTRWDEVEIEALKALNLLKEAGLE